MGQGTVFLLEDRCLHDNPFDPTEDDRLIMKEDNCRNQVLG